MGTLHQAVCEFGIFSSRVKSICDETVTCFRDIQQTLSLDECEGEGKDVLSTAALSEVEGALRKKPSVIFIGDRNCGKSSLLNEVLRGSYLPVHENPCTSRIVRVVFAETAYAELINRDGKVIDTNKKIPREFVVMSDEDKEHGEKLQCTVKVGLNNELLSSGIELIDSPGRNENDELDSVLDEFLKDGTVPLIVYIIDAGTGLRQTDRKTIQLLQDKFPQVSFMFVCNKVDTTSGAGMYDHDGSDDEDEETDEVDAKELPVFHKLKDAKLIPPEAEIGSYPFFHAVSAKETKEGRKAGKRNQAVEMFERFEKCLKEKLEEAIKQETKRAVDKLLVLQQSFVNGVSMAHNRQKEKTQSIRLEHYPDIFADVVNAEIAFKNTLTTLAANQKGIQLLIENKLRSLEQNFMRKAEQYEVPTEGKIRGDMERSTVEVGDPEMAFEHLYLMDNVSLPFARFVEDMKETILSETFNALRDPLIQTMNNSLANASTKIMCLSETFHDPAVARIFQESYRIDLKASQDQSDHLLLVVLDGLFDSIGKIVTVAFRREISGPLSEALLHGPGLARVRQDIKDKENRREVVKVLLSHIDSCHVSEALIKECRDVFENMHDTFRTAITNLRDFILVLLKDSTSSQLKNLQDIHTPRVRGLAIKGLALQFLMKYGPADLGNSVVCSHPTDVYDCLSPRWSHDDKPSVVKVVEKSKVDHEIWKRTCVDLINTWDIFGKYGRVHPNFLRVHGWLIPEDNVLHIVMEKAQTDLLTALRRRMPLNKRLKIAADVILGLKAMHKVGYVYQDLKPETVLLMADGTAKIDMATPEKPFEETRLGCPFHISPEMYRNYSTGVALSSYDIYAFGMLLWVLCEGTGETRPRPYSACATNASMQNAVKDGVVPERPRGASDACWYLMVKCWTDRNTMKIDKVLELVNKLRT